MAAPFRFRLRTILKLRKQKENEHKRIVAVRVRELNGIRQRADRIQQQIRQETEAVRAERSTGVLSIQDISRHRHWLTHLQRSLLDTYNQARSTEAILAQERSELTRASREAKAVEKLKERQKKRHDEESRRKENRELDEIAVIRFPRIAIAGAIGS